MQEHTEEAIKQPVAEEPVKAQRATKPGRQENVYLAKIGLMIFVTFVCCILFFFILLRYEGFSDIWNEIMKAGQPIIIGLVLAYLLNPIMQFAEGLLYKALRTRMKTEEKAMKMSRALGIAFSIVFLIAVIALLIAAIVPSVVTSIMSLAETVPKGVRNLVSTMESGVLGNFQLTEMFGDFLTKATAMVQDWAENTLLPQAQTYIANVTSGVISVVKLFMNFIIGIIVAMYVLMIKEKLIGQSKKLIYAVFKPKAGNTIVEIVHKADEIFGGFIIGKIIDSAIIGVICYIGCCLMRIPDAMLVAVVVGVTNIIPVFGPFIGAVPSLLLVVIQSPWHALYLLIFIIVLQQVDGNIIGPKILGNSTGFSSFWVMFSILIGGGLFGFLGMLLGVPVFALIYYVVRKLVNHSIDKRKLPMATEEYVNLSRVDEETRTIVCREEQKKKKRK